MFPVSHVTPFGLDCHALAELQSSLDPRWLVVTRGLPSGFGGPIPLARSRPRLRHRRSAPSRRASGACTTDPPRSARPPLFRDLNAGCFLDLLARVVALQQPVTRLADVDEAVGVALTVDLGVTADDPAASLGAVEDLFNPGRVGQADAVVAVPVRALVPMVDLPTISPFSTMLMRVMVCPFKVGPGVNPGVMP